MRPTKDEYILQEMDLAREAREALEAVRIANNRVAILEARKRTRDGIPEGVTVDWLKGVDDAVSVNRTFTNLREMLKTLQDRRP